MESTKITGFFITPVNTVVGEEIRAGCWLHSRESGQPIPGAIIEFGEYIPDQYGGMLDFRKLWEELTLAGIEFPGWMSKSWYPTVNEVGRRLYVVRFMGTALYLPTVSTSIVMTVTAQVENTEFRDLAVTYS